MGGDHKCPLCSATFTRPQHVGRHLRAHTGDRPYECKECPLRFARSDLLSRHVNKAHKPPDENGNPPKGKKGRRKSMPTSAQPPIPLPLDDDHAGKARRASFHQSGQLSGQIPANLEYTSPHISQSTGQPQPPPLQAQSMYPHHPLLATTPQTSRDAQAGHWTSNLPLSMDNLAYTSMLNNQFAPGTMGMPALAPNYTQGITSSVANTFQPPFTAVPMRLSGSDQGSAAMGRNNSSGSLNSLGYEFGFKKRACDQCNHSKVRCDFTEPCQRCANRNLRCSYNKPQKSRSIAALPVPRAVQPHLPVNASMSSNIPGVSDSPQSQYSSPHSNPSPVTSTMAAPGVPPLQAPMPLPMQDSNAMLYTQGWQHNQWQSSNNQPLDNPYATTQQSPQSSMYASISSLPSTTSSQHQPLPLPHRHSGSSTLSSPHNRMLQTPSLTSLTTSPDTDGPPERRNSSSSFNNNNFHADIKGQSMDPNAVSDGFSGASISPSHMHGVAGMQDPSMYQSDANAYAWAGPMGATIDPRQQFRNLTSAGEESDRMNHPSTASATGDGLDEAALKALNERRRSSNSTGFWANAFNQMTLQDGIVDPYTASQYAQASTASARRPSYPTHLAMPEGSGVATAKIPSLGDVKDLWKLFMSEPMTSSMIPSSSADAFDYGNLGASSSATAASLMTPPVRPGVGARGLSRSNSMPDLTSPLANGNAQPFFSGLAITPKPALPRSSYVQSQYADMPPATAVDATAGNEVLMRSWKDSIKNRQASFEFGANPQAKMKSPMPSNAMPPTDPSIASMGDYMSNNFGRPLASVLQHSSALQQTLAPERTPSFGGDNLHMSGKPSFRANAAKYSSSLARPGNKRLASQTLVPNDGKKTSGDSWDDNMGMMGGEDDTSAGFVIPTGLGGGTGMTPNPMLGHQYFAWTAPPAVPGMGMGHHSGF